MPGVSLEGLAQAGTAELAELRRELGAFRGAVEGQLEQALRRVQPLAQALRALEEEHLELRAELARLGHLLDLLVLRLGPQDPPGEDLSTLFLEAQDPCAHFEGTEEPGGPVAHPPAFSSTRQQPALHLSRSNSGVSAGCPAPRQCLAGGGEWEGGTGPQGSWRPWGSLERRRSPWREVGPWLRCVGSAASLGFATIWARCCGGQTAPVCSALPACRLGGQAAGSCPAPACTQQW